MNIQQKKNNGLEIPSFIEKTNDKIERVSIGTCRLGNFLFAIPETVIYHKKIETVTVSRGQDTGSAFTVPWMKIRKNGTEAFHSSPDFVTRNGEETFLIFIGECLEVHVYDYGELKQTFIYPGKISFDEIRNAWGCR